MHQLHFTNVHSTSEKYVSEHKRIYVSKWFE